jgi:hypothetical protein
MTVKTPIHGRDQQTRPTGCLTRYAGSTRLISGPAVELPEVAGQEGPAYGKGGGGWRQDGRRQSQLSDRVVVAASAMPT